MDTQVQDRVTYTTTIVLQPQQVLEMVYRKADAKQPFYDEAVAVCLDASEKMDEARWLIGDMALLVCQEKHYGDDKIGDFAKRINISVDRAKEYRLMAEYYEKSARADSLAHLANLSYSHYRIAKQLKNHGGLDASIKFLELCADNSWTIEAAIVELNRLLGREPKVKEGADAEAKPEPEAVIECYITAIEGTTVTLNATNVRDLKTGRLYRIEVYALAAEED